MQSDDAPCDGTIRDKKHDDRAPLYPGMGCRERTRHDEQAERTTNATYRWAEALS